MKSKLAYWADRLADHADAWVTIAFWAFIVLCVLYAMGGDGSGRP